MSNMSLSIFRLIFSVFLFFFFSPPHWSLRGNMFSLPSLQSVEFQRHIAQVICQHRCGRITVRETVSSAPHRTNEYSSKRLACSISKGNSVDYGYNHGLWSVSRGKTQDGLSSLPLAMKLILNNLRERQGHVVLDLFDHRQQTRVHCILPSFFLFSR